MSKPSIPLRRCKKCGEEFPATIEFFHRKKDGLRYECKACRVVEGKLERELHHERVRSRERRSYQANKARHNEYSKNYRKDHIDKLHKYDKQYYQSNKRRVNERNYRYKRLHPEFSRIDNSKRRARIRQAGGSHTPADIKAQIKSQTDKRGVLRCWWCEQPIEKTYHLDHRIPLAKGGSNDARNLCISCPKCNLSKHDKLPHEFNGRLL